MPAPLNGIRIQLSGAIPDELNTQEANPIESFVEKLCRRILQEGGSIIHGSHPSFTEPLRRGSAAYIAADGRRDAITLVRSHKFATDEFKYVISGQEQFATVHVIPADTGDFNKSLIPMRTWMADRSDVLVAIGGKHYDASKSRAGIPAEIDEAIKRGLPVFLVAGLGGAVEGYLNDNPSIINELKNGLPASENKKLLQEKDIDLFIDVMISQIKNLPIVKKNPTRTTSFRILALDGGGIRGAFTAAVLAKWDDMIKAGGGNGIAEHFDMIAGTSTGAILAIGLGLGKTPAEMLDFYKKEGPKIFPQDRKLRHWLKSKHDSSTLATVLKDALGNIPLSASKSRLVIPTVIAGRGRSETITTPHAADRTQFRTISAVEAALASSAAPTYFDEAIYNGPITRESFLDGGIWANNPILPAIAEASRYLQVPLDKIEVLSIGTLGNEKDFSEVINEFGEANKKKSAFRRVLIKLGIQSGKIGWAADATDLFFAAQEAAAVEIAAGMLGPSKILRINEVTSFEIPLDNVAAIDELISRGNEVAKANFTYARSRFLGGAKADAWVHH